MRSSSVEEQNEIVVNSRKILEKVKEVLEDEEAMREIGKIHKEEIKKYTSQLCVIQKVELLLEENWNLNKSMVVQIKDEDVQRSFDEQYGEDFSADGVVKKTIEQYLKTLLIELDERDLETLLKNRLVSLLKRAELPGKDEDEMIELYENALAVSDTGYRVIHKRDVDEIFVNNYNTEWILN